MIERDDNGDTERGSESGVVTVAEAANQHPGKWILLRIKEHDDRGNPSAGLVIQAAGSRGAISKVVRTTRGPKVPYYIFHAPPHRGQRLALRLLGISGDQRDALDRTNGSRDR